MAKVGVKEVAEHAGVSVGSVSKVLNTPELVSPRMQHKVRASMEALGYVRNGLARGLRTGSTSAVGLIVLDMGNPFFAGFAHELEEAAERVGLTIIVGSTNQNASREERYIDLFEEHRVRGLLITPQHGWTERLRRLQRLGTPIVLLDPNVDTREVCAISMDGSAGGLLAGKHLIQSGRRRLLFAGGPLPQVADRLRGFRDAADGHASLEVMETRDLTTADGHRVANLILSLPPRQRPDAVFAGNDLLAVGILEGLIYDGNISVPRDIAVVGYDGIDFAATTMVPLTTIRQPRRAMADEAIRVLEEEASGAPGHVHRLHSFPPELVVRASSMS